MFTGIIHTIGAVRSVEPLHEGLRLALAAPWAVDLGVGESVAVDGACLTVVNGGRGVFVVEAVRETVARTIIGTYVPGRPVHLERPLAVGDPLGGHFVQGHVDARATVQSIERQGENRYIQLEIPASGRPLVAPQGSIALNGVSLTVLAVTEKGVRLSIIPHTWRATTFADLAPGDAVNVEYDLIARYVARMMESR